MLSHAVPWLNWNVCCLNLKSQSMMAHPQLASSTGTLIPVPRLCPLSMPTTLLSLCEPIMRALLLSSTSSSTPSIWWICERTLHMLGMDVVVMRATKRPRRTQLDPPDWRF